MVGSFQDSDHTAAVTTAVAQGLVYSSISRSQATVDWSTSLTGDHRRLPPIWDTPLQALRQHHYFIRANIPQTGNCCGDTALAFSLWNNKNAHNNNTIDFSPLVIVPESQKVIALQQMIRKMMLMHVRPWSVTKFKAEIPAYVRISARDGNEANNDISRLNSLRTILQGNDALNLAALHIASAILKIKILVIIHDMRMHEVAPQLHEINADKSPVNKIVILFLSYTQDANIGHFEPILYEGGISLFDHNHGFPKSLSLIANRWQTTEPTLHIHITEANENTLPTEWPRDSANSLKTPPRRSRSIVETAKTNPATRTRSLPVTRTKPATSKENSTARTLNLQSEQQVDTTTHVVDATGKNAALQIAAHGPLILRLYPTTIPSWTAQCQRLFSNLNRSLRNIESEPRNVDIAVAALLRLPAVVLTRSIRGGKQRSPSSQSMLNRLKSKSVHTKLDQFAASLMTDDIEELNSTTPKAHILTAETADDNNPNDSQNSASTTSANATRSLTANDDLAAALKCRQLLSNGHASRAVQALTRTESLANSEDANVISELRRLHPENKCQVPAPPPNTSFVQVESDAVKRLMASSNNGSSPGPSGWGSNMLEVLAEDAQCVEGVRLLVEHIVNNNLPSVSRIMLTSSSLIALEKTTGGVRPIAVSELFYKLAAQYAMGLIAPVIKKHVGKHQFGVNEPMGCATIVHTVQRTLTDEQKPLANLGVDVSNAYNEMERTAFIEPVNDSVDLQTICPIGHFAYQEPSLLMHRVGKTKNTIPADQQFEVILSKKGTKQGDPMSATLFSIGVKQAYEKAAAECEDRCLSYIDDCNLQDTPEKLLEVLIIIERELAKVGLTINKSKCVLTYFQDMNPETLQKWNQLGVRVEDKCTWLLGAVIGKDDQSIINELATLDNRWTTRRENLHRRIAHLPAQQQMLILQRLNSSTINHQLNCMPPSVTTEHAKLHDEMSITSAAGALGLELPLNESVKQQIMLPLNLGGFGVLSARVAAAPAFINAAYHTITSSPAFSNWADGSTPLPLNDPMTKNLIHARQDIIALADSARLAVLQPDITPDDTITTNFNNILPNNMQSIVSFFNHQQIFAIHSTISRRLSNNIYNALMTKAERINDDTVRQREMARLFAVQAERAQRWLQVATRSQHTRLFDDEYRWCAKLRLGITLASVADMKQCDACGSALALHEDKWHWLACKALIAKEGVKRHNNISTTLVKYARMAYLEARYEPANLDQHDRKRPDVDLIDVSNRTLVDAVVVHPTAPSHRALGSKGLFEVAREAIDRKHRKYQQMTSYQKAKFKAFACETYGGITNQAKSVVNQIASAAEKNGSPIPRNVMINEMLDEIAMNIQRGNARMIREGELRQAIKQLT
jgi:hypothetical protein